MFPGAAPARLRPSPALKVGLAWGLGYLVFAGAVAVLIPTGIFIRMTPTAWWDYVFLPVSAALVGLFMGLRTHYASTGATAACKTTAGAGGAAAFVGLSCPVCNKLLVALIGVGGALIMVEPYRALISTIGVVTLALSILWLYRTNRPAQAAQPVIQGAAL